MTAEPGIVDVPLAVRAEAAAWIARLHGPERTLEDEVGFRRWLAADALHAVAFERMTEAWEAAARLRSDVLVRHGAAGRESRQGLRGRNPWAVAAAAAVATIALAVFYLRVPAISTQLGERRNLTLEDGTRLTLNTSTRVQIRYAESQRSVRLEEGEAYFEVARDPGRPFVVTTAVSDIEALGTIFSVRTDGAGTVVTLIEGKVLVSPHVREDAGDEPAPEATVMKPGERLSLRTNRSALLDRPVVEEVTAWRQGLIALDRTSLRDAVAEMNRYSPLKLRIAAAVDPEIRVSGVFRAGDSLEFARALTRSHGLKLQESDTSVVIQLP